MKSVRRLYKELKPSNYQLEIAPDIQAMTFMGTVQVRLKKTGRPSQRLTFHQNGLTITSATIVKHDKKGDRELPVVRINNQNTLHEVRLHTEELVYGGDYTVTMVFKSPITRTMTGLYPCYFMLNGQEHIMIGTHLESHYAREIFPCIDEPEAKATFDLTLISPKDLSVLGNTPVLAEKRIGETNLIATTFETTPKMSTYLLAFAMGELQSISTKTKKGTDISVWSTVAQPHDSLDFALDVAKRSVEFYEDYFGIPYPLAKLDHIALPDFSMGAMENWGLITYRERRILAYKGQTSQASLEGIAKAVTHETAHQWFGNLVTMRWWDELWLNESFARLMEFQSLDALFPAWHMWDHFAADVGLSALRRDAIAGVQAVHTPVHHPDEINSLFDPAIVYGKGARVLNMLKAYIGEAAFQQGLCIYFKKHAYGNTVGADLWQAFSEASGQDIAAFMSPWLEQGGFPVVTIDQSTKAVTLRQEHFLDHGGTSDGRLWSVPLFSGNSELPDLLDTAKKNITVQADKSLLLNVGSAGHYIPYYKEASHRAAIAELVRNQALGISDRLLLLNNASMLSKAGYEPFGQVLKLLDAYKDEHDGNVWGMISDVLGEARRFVNLDESLETPLKIFTRELIAGEYARLGWEERTDESSTDRKLRATIIELGLYAEDNAITQRALDIFEQYRSSTTPILAELRPLVFSAAIRKQGPDTLSFLLDQHDSTLNGELKLDIAFGVSATRNADHAAALLARLTNPDLVKPQDVPFWFLYLQSNRHTHGASWQWLVDNWTWLEQTFRTDALFDRFPKAAADVRNTAEHHRDFDEFFTPKLEDKAIQLVIRLALNEISTRVKWLERDLPSVQTFFRQSNR